MSFVNVQSVRLFWGSYVVKLCALYVRCLYIDSIQKPDKIQEKTYWNSWSPKLKSPQRALFEAKMTRSELLQHIYSQSEYVSGAVWFWLERGADFLQVGASWSAEGMI